MRPDSVTVALPPPRGVAGAGGGTYGIFRLVALVAVTVKRGVTGQRVVAAGARSTPAEHKKRGARQPTGMLMGGGGRAGGRAAGPRVSPSH